MSDIIEMQYKRACDLLKKNKNKLKQLAERLLEKEVIFKDDLFNILGERPYDVKPDKKEDGKDGVQVAVN